MFLGREKELEILEKRYKSARSELVVIYGRRRIGKSRLLEEFTKKKKNKLCFEGLEDASTKEQIKHFLDILRKQHKDPYLGNLDSWEQVFSYITDQVIPAFEKKKLILVFDEFQWMAVGRKKLVSLLKFYWDNHWKNSKVMLVLCGSIASFMVNKVIKSKALFGRINQKILLKGLSPKLAKKMFLKKRGDEEVLRYLMIFGCIPRYLEEINLNQSLRKNMNELCFSNNGFMIEEYEKIFYNQFKDAKIYQQVAKALSDRPLGLSGIAKKLKVKTIGGSFQQIIRNLEDAGIISSYISFDMPHNTKYKKFKLTDEYLVFYYKYIFPNLRSIKEERSSRLFEELCESKWQSWLGIAFERFCFKNANYIAQKLGFSDELINVSPYYGKSDEKFQIDLIFERSGKVITICEVKYYDKQISTSIIPEFSRKCDLLKLPEEYTVEKALITIKGIDKALEESQYFHHVLNVKDIL